MYGSLKIFLLNDKRKNYSLKIDNEQITLVTSATKIPEKYYNSKEVTFSVIIDPKNLLQSENFWRVLLILIFAKHIQVLLLQI